MKSFKDIEFEEVDHLQGVCGRLHFENGYGVSVVKHKYSYGGPQGLYELAVLHNDEITYDTPITDDVIGYLRVDEVTDIMHRVQKLPK